MKKREIVLAAVTVAAVLLLVTGLVFFAQPREPAVPTPSASAVPTALPSPERSAGPQETVVPTPALPSPSPSPSPLPLEPGFADIAEEIPDAIIALSYYSEDNFTGRRVPGYEANRGILTVEACTALRKAADRLREEGYRLYIFDAYRPVDAVRAFIVWGQDETDTLRKEDFYPTLSKKELFQKYISSDSRHSRGSTVDLTLVSADGTAVEMGCRFDYFGELAHTFTDQIGESARQNRMILRQAMEEAGFEGSSSEWWHFRLLREPYPDKPFNFTIR